MSGAGAGQPAVLPESFELLLSANPVPMWVYDLESLRFLAVNRAAVERYGYSREQFLAMRLTDVRPPVAAGADGPWRHLTADGRLLRSQVISHEVVWGGRPAILAASEQVGEDDPGSGAPDDLPVGTVAAGEPTLRRRVERDIARAARTGGRAAVIVVELLHVEDVEAVAGMAGAYAVAEEMEARLGGVTGAEDAVLRLDGRRFGLACVRPDPAGVVALAQAAVEVLEDPVELPGNAEVALAAAAGVRVVTPGETDGGRVAADVVVALREAGRRPRGGRVVLFEEPMRGAAVERLDLERSLRRALQGDELSVHYEPIVDAQTLEVGGYEALLRWRRPGLGYADPATVIGVAEESGLIEGVGAWVRERALAEVGTALRYGQRPMVLSLNLSGHELDLPDLTPRVLSLCERAAIDPGSLCFELTESSLVSATEDPKRYEQVLALEAIGVGLALDDFGTGYSALSYLKHLPVDVVKIDRSFVAGLDVSEADAVLVEAITRMSHALGLRVVAEGVETESELAVLREIGVDHVQGYLFARPMAWADAVRARLAP